MSPDFALDPEVVAYYQAGREDERLRTIGRLEFLRTQELLARFLPAPPARVLDVGGGGGIHSIPLLKQGYHVALIDPMPLHVQQAKVSPRDPPVPSTGAPNRGSGV
jgi:2-polyprenyl-3-methyl-5-hydroxy-6-metoxy-1,4-benzoquinol methylase